MCTVLLIIIRHCCTLCMICGFMVRSQYFIIRYATARPVTFALPVNQTHVAFGLLAICVLSSRLIIIMHFNADHADMHVHVGLHWRIQSCDWEIGSLEVIWVCLHVDTSRGLLSWTFSIFNFLNKKVCTWTVYYQTLKLHGGWG